jgi:glycerate dehydrogenase
MKVMFAVHKGRSGLGPLYTPFEEVLEESDVITLHCPLLPEPPPADSVLMRLLQRPDFILTPHIAWTSTEAQQTLADQLIDNLESFARGTPTNVVLGAF